MDAVYGNLRVTSRDDCIYLRNGTIVSGSIDAQSFSIGHVDGDSPSSAPQSEHQVKRGLSLDVIILKSAAIFELSSRKDESLLIGRNSFFILDQLFHILYGDAQWSFDLDCFSSEGFDEENAVC